MKTPMSIFIRFMRQDRAEVIPIRLSCARPAGGQLAHRHPLVIPEAEQDRREHRQLGQQGLGRRDETQYVDPGHGIDGSNIYHSRFLQSRHRSEEHTSELQSLMRISYAVFCLKKKKRYNTKNNKY